MAIVSSLGLIIITCIVIWRACDGFEMASDYLGRNMKEGIKGATINAIGSSLPELFTTLFFLFVLKDKDGFSGGIGTTAGSAVFNAMIIPAVVIMAVIGKGIVSRINVSKKVIKRDGISLILGEIVLILLITGTELHWYHGFILMLLYVIYIAFMLLSQGSGDVDNDYEDEAEGGNRAVALFKGDLATAVLGDKKINLTKAWLLMLVSVFFIGIACYWLVEACEQFGEAIGMPIYFVSVVLASAATSVPDTIISWKDAMKGNYDDAVANALGSNIFDICFALGFPLFLFTLIYGPITMSPETLENVGQLRVLLLIITIIAFFIYLVPKTIRKSHGYVLITLYALFVMYIILKGIDSDLAIITGISDSLSGISNFFSSIF
ncbi:sodium:calcium antiporter [Kordia algicida OT-1]|uniref:tRNA pseudouridine synthase A n=1 Tax=Kordia algicida OT-1 TaxID=391587 RepID=A9E0L1_9FLAO|nr:sodium:calcium antiporter [Kordia algicida]EDP95886.1 tRNA pseudouridine synthase A [Kordia algicida OT-1]